VTEVEEIRRSERHFDGAAGLRLFARSWLPPQPSRSLLLVHGYAEHSGRYDHVGAWFAARGFAVHAYDHQGHGHSGGTRCHVSRFDDFLDDLDGMVERVRGEAPKRPLFVVGHSMGGLIVCAWARERRPRVEGLVVSSPALRASGLSPLRRKLLRVLRRIRPKASIESELDAEGLSRDPAVVQAYLADPLVNLRMTLSLGAELFAAMERTAPGGADVALPMLLVQGEDDPLCAPPASEAFARAAPDCRYRSYPGLRHEIFNEPEQESVFADIQSWIEEEMGKRRAAAEST
jgi:alpha-beta hydrolase superfamily lysophospholipase